MIGTWILRFGVPTNTSTRGIGGLFIHEKWHETEQPNSVKLKFCSGVIDRELFRYAGWWGHELSTWFDMPLKFSLIKGAQGFQQSNPSALVVASLIGSLRVFKSCSKEQG